MEEQHFTRLQIAQALSDAYDDFRHERYDGVTVISAGSVTVWFYFGCCGGSQHEPHVRVEHDFRHVDPHFNSVPSRAVFGTRRCEFHEPGRIEADVLGPWIEEQTRLAIQKAKERAEDYARMFAGG